MNGICIPPSSTFSFASIPSTWTPADYQRLIALLPKTSLICQTDNDCPYPARCILNRCLTPTDLQNLPAFCGNSRLDPGESCDDGSQNSDAPNALCRPDCTPSRCGDFIVDTPLEQCDDGNTAPGDGCSSQCAPERTAPTETLPATVIELPFTQTSASSLQPQGPNGPNAPSSVITKASVPSTADTGPAALAVMIAGAAAGYAWRRRKE